MAKGQGQKKTAAWLELPYEVVCGLPRITLVGAEQMLIENHRGIIEHTGFRVRVNTGIGVIRVEGASLTVERINGDDIRIQGTLHELYLPGAREGESR